MDEKKYVWTVGSHEYVLVPEVRFGPKRLWLMGAGMYRLDGVYVGYWARREMPIRLVRDLTAYCKHLRQRGPAKKDPVRRTYRGRREKKLL